MSQEGEEPEHAGENDREVHPWARKNLWVIAGYIVLSLVGIALATGWVPWMEWIVTPPGDDGLVAVPAFIIVYASLGALGYIFTKLMVEFDEYATRQRLETLLEMGMRIPAAWLLATGLYLFIGELPEASAVSGPTFAAGVAFLVGLYVNVALKALGSLADRILGRGRSG